MSSGEKNYMDMDSKAFMEYVKRCPQKYIVELPAKIEEWAKMYAAKEALKNMSNATIFPIESDKVDMRLEISKAIVVHHAPTAVSDPTQLADYAVEMADALIDRLKRP
jgi:hypothetical protein